MRGNHFHCIVARGNGKKKVGKHGTIGIVPVVLKCMIMSNYGRVYSYNYYPNLLRNMLVLFIIWQFCHCCCCWRFHLEWVTVCEWPLLRGIFYVQWGPILLIWLCVCWNRLLRISLFIAFYLFQGVTFSDKINGKCDPCTQCKVKEVKISNCTVDQNTKCKPGEKAFSAWLMPTHLTTWQLLFVTE